MRTSGSFQIAVVRGIPIRIHVSLLAILPFLAWSFGTSFSTAARMAGVPTEELGNHWLWGFAIAVALFASVLLHELAHSLYAIARGGKVRGITLLMIGGISEVSQPPRTPGQEALMAFVGPATSLAIAALSFLGFAAARSAGAWSVAFALFYLGYLNAFLGVFNLLPAFPMDGGRVLRGVLAKRVGPVRATQLAASVGKTFAVIFAIWGFATGNFILLLVAFFVWAGAEAEARDVLVRTVLGELRVRDLMTPSADAVPPEEAVYAVGERMLQDRRLGYPVVRDGEVVGYVTLEAIEGVPPEARPTTRVAEVMRAPAVISTDAPVSDALRLLDAEGIDQLAVADGGRLVGTISRFEINRGLRLRELETALHRRLPWPPRRGRATIAP
jgi:Zn-dependent protease/CBS domain-containing protein